MNIESLILARERSSEIDSKLETKQVGDFYLDLDLRTPRAIEVARIIDSYVDIYPNMNTLEMGTGGLGYFSLVMSLLGADNVYGIEAQPDRFEVLKEVFSTLAGENIIPENRCHFAQGNYFPNDFDVTSEAKWLHWEEGRQKYEHLNPYKELGVELEEMDVLYFYQYFWNKPATLNLLAERCHSGALIFVPGQSRFTKLPREIERVYCYEKRIIVEVLKVR